MMKFLYKKVLKPILFCFDPELVHNVFVAIGEQLGRFSAGRAIISFFYRYSGSNASTVIDGIEYRYPIILSAGFDYNGRLVEILDCMSFGGVEIGSVTARPCKGNPKPRLKRMIKSESLVVYKGLKNIGVEQIIANLKKRKKPPGMVWGISIAKTNDPEASTFEGGIEDYYYSLKRLAEENIGDFYTINISCPNVHGGEDYTTPDRLEGLLAKLKTVKHERPMYIKMPINTPWDDFQNILKVIDKFQFQGVVIGNLNKDYNSARYPEESPKEYRGGLSGRPCFELSTELIRKTRKEWGDRFTIMGCGGVMFAEDAMKKLDAGADIIQMISGMIFEGPHLMKDICQAYAQRND